MDPKLFETHWTRDEIVRALSVAAAVLATAWLGIELSRQSGYIAALWLPNAIVASALIVRRYGRWAGIAGPSAVAYVAANMLTGNGLGLSVALTACNLIEAGLVAGLLRRIDPSPDLTRPRTMIAFCVIALGPAPAVSAVLGARALSGFVGAPFLDVLSVWYAADALGLLIVVPVALSLREGEITRLFSAGRLSRAMAMFAFVLVTTGVIFWQDRYPLLFLAALPLVLTTFRLGLAGTAVSLVLMGAAAVAATMHDLGPIALVDGTQQERLLMLQLFVAAAALTCFPIAATLAEQRRLAEALQIEKDRVEKSEAGLQKVARRLAITLDNMDQGIFMADREGRLRVHNRRALDLLDLPESLIADDPSVDDVLAFQRKRGDFDPLSEAERRRVYPFMSDQESSIYERAGPNGTVLEIRTSRIPGGGVVRTYTDVTARRLAERQLSEREAQYRLLAENSGDIIARLDLDGRNKYVSPAIRHVLGYSPADTIGHSFAGIVHPEDRQSVSKALEALASGTRAKETCSYRSRRRGGAWAWLETHLRLVVDQHGSPVEVIATTRDVTERETQAQALAQAREEAEESAREALRANRAKSDFLAGMSHELRTPLNAVIGFGQILQMNRQGRLSQSDLEYCGHIVKGGRHLLNLVSELLDLAGIESGRIKLSLEPLSVRESIRSAIDTMRPIAAKAGISLEASDATPEGLTMQADAQRLRQVLLNLLSNAIKYNREAGWVRIGAAPAPEGGVRISVEDSGIGIAEEHRSLIFEPFSRLGAEFTPVEGTGIGLSLSKKLVEAMQGRIGFATEAGKGSTFWIELPVARPGAQPIEIVPDDALVPMGMGDRTLLYVEDNPTNLQLMESLVRTVPGLTLITAPSGSLGLDMADDLQPDVIVLDLHLPGMSGWEVLKRLKASQRTKGIPVIALTASALPRDEARGRQAGFFQYLSKPLDVKGFLEAVRLALPASSGPGEPLDTADASGDAPPEAAAR